MKNRRIIPEYKNIQDGGDRVIPKYEDIKNNPFDNKVKVDKILNVQNNKSNEVFLKGSLTIPNQQSFYPNFVTGPYIKPIIPNDFPYAPPIPMFVPSNRNNIVNNYQIVTPRVTDDHTFFEMTFPSSPEGKIYKSSNNLKERININNYIRNSLVRVSDGEYINLDDNYSNETRNLMSYIKVINLNPYSHELNPYKNLPENFMIYNSGFPVIKKENSDIVELNKNNVGLNLRIYSIDGLEIGPIISFNFNDYFNNDYKDQIKKFLSCKVNNDIFYYNFVKNIIILKNICPHFALIHGYFISSGKNHNLKKLFKNNFEKLISLKRDKFLQQNSLKNNSIFSEYDKILMENLINATNNDLDRIHEPKIKFKFIKINLDKKVNFYKLIIIENTDIKNNLLLALTEAPNINLKDWYTNSYKYKDLRQKIKVMTNNGYHVKEVWESILFQLYYTLMIMIIYGIKIENIDLSNIFIKNISDHENKIFGYWIYEIYGVKFYIKNYGFLLLIDSNFINQINFNMYIENDNDKKDFNESNFNYIKNLFDLIKKDDIMNNEVLDFINYIYTSLTLINDFNSLELKTSLIKNLIILFGNKFLNNKIGDEVDSNLPSKNKLPLSGDIIDYLGNYAIFIKINEDNFVITKNDNELNFEYLEDITNFNIYNNLEQKLIDDGSKFDIKKLLDTYILK